MSDLDQLHELSGQFRRPAFDDLVAVSRRRRRRAATIAGATAAAVVIAAIAAVNGVAGPPRGASDPAGPSPSRSVTTSPGDTRTGEVPDGQPEVLAVRQTGRYRVEVRGQALPGRWLLAESRADVWTGSYVDDVGYVSNALWWGKGTTTHEVVGSFGGAAISQDARWIAWIRAPAAGYDNIPNSPRVIEVADTATGEVRWSTDAEAVNPDIGVLAVTNDGVVVFGRCIDIVAGDDDWPQCGGVSLHAWAPRSGVTSTLSTELPELLVTGAHNGFLLRDAELGNTPAARPEYVTVSATGEVDVVATLPRNALAVTADERFALLATQCPEGSMVCGWSVRPLDGGEPRPIPGLADLVAIPLGYNWPVGAIVVEQEDRLILRALGLEGPFYPPVVRCSLEQARCVPLRE